MCIGAIGRRLASWLVESKESADMALGKRLLKNPCLAINCLELFLAAYSVAVIADAFPITDSLLVFVEIYATQVGFIVFGVVTVVSHLLGKPLPKLISQIVSVAGCLLWLLAGALIICIGVNHSFNFADDPSYNLDDRNVNLDDLSVNLDDRNVNLDDLTFNYDAPSVNLDGADQQPSLPLLFSGVAALINALVYALDALVAPHEDGADVEGPICRQDKFGEKKVFKPIAVADQYSCVYQVDGQKAAEIKDVAVNDDGQKVDSMDKNISVV